jgi:hypothetical protein
LSILSRSQAWQKQQLQCGGVYETDPHLFPLPNFFGQMIASAGIARMTSDLAWIFSFFGPSCNPDPGCTRPPANPELISKMAIRKVYSGKLDFTNTEVMP